VINQAPAEKKPKKMEECEYCHKMFSIQGIDSHRRLKHGVKKGGEKAKDAKAGLKEDVKPIPEGDNMPEEALSDKGVVIDKPLKEKKAKEDDSKEDVPNYDDFEDFEDFDEYDEEEKDEEEEGGLGLAPLIIGAAILGILAFVLYNFILKRPEVEQKVQDFSQGENLEPLPQQPFQPVEAISQPDSPPVQEQQLMQQPVIEPSSFPQEQATDMPGLFRPPEQAQVPMPPRQKRLVLLGKQR
jgi:hypothetical protein